MIKNKEKLWKFKRRLCTTFSTRTITADVTPLHSVNASSDHLIAIAKIIQDKTYRTGQI